MPIFYQSSQIFLALLIPLLIVAIGGMFSERGGVVNIALEGIMIFGAYIGVMFLFFANKTSFAKHNPILMYLIGLAIAVISGGLISMLHSFASINLGADQAISATAINIFAPAFALFFTQATKFAGEGTFNVAVSSKSYVIDQLHGMAEIPFFGDIFFKKFYLALFIGILLVVFAQFILYKTKFGLRLRACGENPLAAEVAGINVYKYRWFGTTISGMLAGAGGFFLITSFYTQFDGSVAGYGFLALAVMIFGAWKPFRILLVAMFFTLITFLSQSTELPFLRGITQHLPSEFFKMIPYLLTIVVLIFSSKRSVAPKAVGRPYIKNKGKKSK